MNSQFKLPDTGQLVCYDVKGKEIIPVTNNSLSRQDGAFLRNPMIFTKLDIKGNVLSEDSSWEKGHRATRDENTGLIWEIKSDSIDDINYFADEYTWQEAQEDYISKLNKSLYCGHSDWRIPNKDELRSIVNYSCSNPAFDSDYFPHLLSDIYWTSVTYMMQPVFGWAFYLGLGSAIAVSKKSKRKVIAVCGGYDPLYGVMSDERFVDNGDGTVTDKVTKLMWQQGDNERMNYFDALNSCKEMDLAGYTDWRLPNIKELGTILNLNREGGWWYFRKFFPVDGLTPPLLHYLSGTSYEHDYTWVVNFNYGYDGYYASKNSPLLFRAVRTIKENDKGNFLLPESGQDRCYDNIGNQIKTPVKGEEFYGQDGCYKINPFSFKKEDKVVTDNNTGLVWEIKSNSSDDFNFKGRKYTWDEANTFIKKLNEKRYCGYTDWRLPNCQELRSIASYEDKIPAIDTNVFNDLALGFYWSNQLYQPNPDMIWGIYFAYGCAICYNKDQKFYVRAVRGGYNPNFGNCKNSNFVDNGDGTITDYSTNLMWKKEESGMLGFKDALKYCENLKLAGYDDWRMPNIREIATLIDMNHTDGVWYHKEFFPDVITKPLGFYWSGTTYASTFGWGVNFQFGYDGYYADKINGKYPFRPVRSL